MSKAYHPFTAARARPERKQGANKTTERYLQQVFAELEQSPEKIAIIGRNMQYYKQQRYLKRGFLRAIERLEWLFETEPSVDLVKQVVFEDSYSGKKLRSYPLLFKGIIEVDSQPVNKS